MFNWPRVSERCDWSSLVSSGIASGHVSPALGERELLPHIFCFSRLTRFSMGYVFAFGVAPHSLVFGCWGSSFFLSVFSSWAHLSFHGSLTGFRTSLGFWDSELLVLHLIFQMLACCFFQPRLSATSLRWSSAGGLFLLPDGTPYSRSRCR